MACLCGDINCPSCEVAQGTRRTARTPDRRPCEMITIRDWHPLAPGYYRFFGQSEQSGRFWADARLEFRQDGWIANVAETTFVGDLATLCDAIAAYAGAW